MPEASVVPHGGSGDGEEPPWVVMLEAERRRWGGDLRRGRLFEALAERTGARVVDGWSLGALRDGVGGLPFVPFPLPFPRLWGSTRPRLASSEMLRPDVLRVARATARLTAVAIYDDPIAQTADLGMRLEPDRVRFFRTRRQANVRWFRWHAVPTRSFAELIGLDLDRVIVSENGTDTDHIRPGEWPDEPAIGMMSGAAPGRGIETLIGAARLLHAEAPELRLLLWLVSTGPDSEQYLARLRADLSRERWIQIDTAEYEDLGWALRQTSVLAIPHPPGAYYDVALPVKLLDSMAAGRPLVVTPRTETREIVERHGAGLVTSGDTAEDLAQALSRILADPAVAREMGAAARRAAEEHYDWRVVGARLASAVLEREG